MLRVTWKVHMFYLSRNFNSIVWRTAPPKLKSVINVGHFFLYFCLKLLTLFLYFSSQLLLQQQFGLLLWSIIWTVLQCIIRTMVMTLNCFNWTKSGYWSSYFRLVPRNLCGPNCSSVIWTVANSTFVNCFSLMYQM